MGERPLLPPNYEVQSHNGRGQKQPSVPMEEDKESTGKKPISPYKTHLYHSHLDIHKWLKKSVFISISLYLHSKKKRLRQLFLYKA